MTSTCSMSPRLFEILKWMDPKIDLRLIAPKAQKDHGAERRLTFRCALWLQRCSEARRGCGFRAAIPLALKKHQSGKNQAYLEFMKDRSTNAKYVCSVCEGALSTSESGPARRLRMHHALVLHSLPQAILPRQVVEGFRASCSTQPSHRRRVSSGLDESLKLVELLSD